MPTDAISGMMTAPAFTVTVYGEGQPAGAGGGAMGIVGLESTAWDTFAPARPLTFNARKELVEGTPSAPCFTLADTTEWHWRWVVGPGNRSLTVYVKQASNASPRPTVSLLANSGIGLAATVVGTAASSTGWTAVTVSFVCSAVGQVWVRFNNFIPKDPCYFDRVSVI